MTVSFDCAGMTQITARVKGTLSGSQHIFEASVDLNFRQSDQVTAILVDGKKVNSNYYTVAEGTVVTLDSKLLQSLALGKHTVVLQFADGEASGSFTVSMPADDSNPKTGDGFALHAWTALLFMSITGIIGTGFACRRKFRK
jgi:hypothetical protein